MHEMHVVADRQKVVFCHMWCNNVKVTTAVSGNFRFFFLCQVKPSRIESRRSYHLLSRLSLNSKGGHEFISKATHWDPLGSTFHPELRLRRSGRWVSELKYAFVGQSRSVPESIVVANFQDGS